MRADALACYGNPAAITPRLDALASEGARFEQCHVVHTKCTPSRSSLLTAQYPHVGGHRTLDMPVQAHEPNMVRALKQHGYATALVGKNHCVDEQTMPRTFDFHGRGRGGDAHLEPADPPPMPVGTYYVGEHPAPLSDNGDHTSTTLAVDWMKQQSTREAPFFCWLNWDAPHPPYRAPREYFGKTDREKIPVLLPPPDKAMGRPNFHDRLTEAYEIGDVTEAQWREVMGCYLDMCAFIDAEVGRVLDALDDMGVADNTIVLFWSDHGDYAGDYRLPEKWDTSFPDCLTRVPLLCRAPGSVEPQVVQGLIESIDILPTALDLTGVPLPEGIQGISYRGVLEGRDESPKDVVFCQGGQEPALLEKTVAPDAKPRPCRAYLMKQAALYAEPAINLRAKMVRDTRYKYIYRLDETEELYDLAKDSGELRNVASDPDYADTLDRMRRRMMKKLVEAETVDPPQDYLDS